MAKTTHSVMSSALAKALMEAGVQHFDAGGMVAPVMAPPAGPPSSGSGVGLGSLIGMSDYNAQLAPTQQTNYGGVINTSAGNVGAGYANSQQIQAQQQALADALLAQSQGRGGPNPAQAALAQQTGNNISQQAALMAGQRGSGANVGMLARQAAQQGGQLQQQAVGQGATLQAQQQLAAQSALQNQQQNMAGMNVAQQGVQSQMFGLGAGAQNAQNNTNVANYGQAQAINAGVADKNSQAVGGAVSGLLGGLGSLATMGLSGGGSAGGGAAGNVGGKNALTSMFAMAKGGAVPDHLHAMAKLYHPEFAQGGAVDYRSGGTVPGQAQVAGDSAKNDTVPAVLSPQEIVLPRSVTQAPNAPDKAADFVRHLQEKGDVDMKKSKGGGYEAVASSKKSLKERIERLEKMYAGGVA